MKNKGKSLTIVLTVIYLFIVVWIILFKMATLSEIVYSDGIRNINLIPFHYDKEAPFHRSEIIKNVIIFIPLGVYLKMLKIKGVKVILFGMDMHRAFDFYDFAFVFFQLGHLSNLNSHQINLKKS